MGLIAEGALKKGIHVPSSVVHAVRREGGRPLPAHRSLIRIQTR